MGIGRLYVVATPIGNLEDISARALRILAEVGLIIAEDTRTSAKLLRHYGIDTPMRSCHEHNERRIAGELVAMLHAGTDLALISDAGTPLVSDPGFDLVRSAHDAGVEVIAIPGPCAVVAALSVAGLPTDRFAFEGFLPAAAAARRRRLSELVSEPRTLVFLEAPHRIAAVIADMAAVLGKERLAALARELTKIHETVVRLPLAELAAAVAGDDDNQRGEMVICVAGSEVRIPVAVEGLRVARLLRQYLNPGQAAAAASEITGVGRNELYRALMASKAPSDDDSPPAGEC